MVVPFWRAAPPAAALDRFAEYGPPTGVSVFGFELLSVVLLSVLLYAAVRARSPARTCWAVAWAAMVGTLLLLPVYFVPTNLALLGRDLSLRQVPGELQAWYAWNWVRVGLAFVAVVFGCLALTVREPARQPTRRPSRHPHGR